MRVRGTAGRWWLLANELYSCAILRWTLRLMGPRSTTMHEENPVTVEQFHGASAIVSGGAGGLGEATVRRLHADGLGVVIADLSADKGKALADELGARAVFVSTDVTSEESILDAIEQANQLGQLRYAVVAHGGYGVAQRIVQRDGSPADFGAFTK